MTTTPISPEGLDPRYLSRSETEMMMDVSRTALTTRLASHDAVHEAESEALGLAREEHRREHAAEHVAVMEALANLTKQQAAHSVAHASAHEAHAALHVQEDNSVTAALRSVASERSIHAAAHEREHEGHQREHALDKLAITKAEAASDIRFSGVNEFRSQLSDQAKTFATMASVEASRRESDRRLDDLVKAMTTSHEANRLRIENLEKGDVKADGKSLGQGTVVGMIVAGAGLTATIMGIIILLANVLNNRPV